MTDSAPLAGRQDQFLTVVSREEAAARLARHLDMRPLGEETVALADSLGRVLSRHLTAPIDVPPFDRSGVDGFAVRAADVNEASDAIPVDLRLNAEIIACGVAPAMAVAPGTATSIATGGPLPRGADAVVMVEHTDLRDGTTLLVRRAATPGQHIAYAGSDIAMGDVLLRRGARIGSRDIGMMAACGLDRTCVFRRPRVAVLSTGDELMSPGQPLRPAAIYDSNGPIIAAAVRENGGEPVNGAIPDDERALEAGLREAIRRCDMVILSGGTSKGAGDLTYRIVSRLGAPGIVAHGVAVKPGKPLCLAVADGKAVVVLPGFPTSAMVTFDEFVVPVLRRLSGLPQHRDTSVAATTPIRIASEMGRTEFVMVALVDADAGFLAFPLSKGSGSVTAFSQADGYLTIAALSDGLPAGSAVSVTLLSPHLRVPELTVMGSHCVGLEAVITRLAEQDVTVRLVAIGSTGGLAAAKRGQCDVAPIHLVDPYSGRYNTPFVSHPLQLIRGWQRMQGIVFRSGDQRFVATTPAAAIAAALADPACRMVNRNQGSGTRVIIDGLLAGARPEGYWNQPSSHNAVAAAVAQSRADWGIAIEPVARAYGLGFLPIAEEHYDFAVVASRRERPAVRAFIEAIGHQDVQRALRDLGFRPAAAVEATLGAAAQPWCP